MFLLFAIFFDTPLLLQVTVQNVSNIMIPEDVELRLVSKSRGVATSTQTMHVCVPIFRSLLRTSAVLLPVSYHAHFLVFHSWQDSSHKATDAARGNFHVSFSFDCFPADLFRFPLVLLFFSTPFDSLHSGSLYVALLPR
jgi:hypothetical protein